MSSVVQFPRIQHPACACGADGSMCSALNLSLPFCMAEKERMSHQTDVFDSSSSSINVSCLHECQVITALYVHGCISSPVFNSGRCAHEVLAEILVLLLRFSRLQTEALCSAAPVWSSVHNTRLFLLICTESCTSGSSRQMF